MIARHLKAAMAMLSGCLLLATASASVHAALVIDGTFAAPPGGMVTLTLGLDAALSADIDELRLRIEFDPAVLHPQSAASGSLLSGSLFLPDVDSGIATASFLATLATLGPGDLASWTFEVDPAAVPATRTSVRAFLDTFVIDDVPTAGLSSAEYSITAVPEPSSGMLITIGLCALGALARWRSPRLLSASMRAS